MKIFELEANPVEDQSLLQRYNKRRKSKGENKIKIDNSKKPTDIHVHVGHFLVQKL